MQDPKKKRSENWSNEEKDILRQLIANSSTIIEDRSTKAYINKKKVEAWKDITNKINEIIGKNRSDVEVKLAWKRMKLAAKANLSLHRREQLKTGGGEKPPSPSEADLEVMAIAPLDFIEERNVYDSDDMTIDLAGTSSQEEPKAGTSSLVEEPVIVVITTEDQVENMKRSISPDIMDPLSPSLLRPTRSNIKKEDKNKTPLRAQLFKPECEDCTININDDRRNEFFAQLLTEELKYINPCMRTRCYIKILNFLNEVKKYHTNQIEVTDTERM